MTSEEYEELWREAIAEAHATLADAVNPITSQGGIRAAAMACVMFENGAANLLENGREDAVQFILKGLTEELSRDPA